MGGDKIFEKLLHRPSGTQGAKSWTEDKTIIQDARSEKQTA